MPFTPEQLDKIYVFLKDFSDKNKELVVTLETKTTMGTSGVTFETEAGTLNAPLYVTFTPSIGAPKIGSDTEVKKLFQDPLACDPITGLPFFKILFTSKIVPPNIVGQFEYDPKINGFVPYGTPTSKTRVTVLRLNAILKSNLEKQNQSSASMEGLDQKQTTQKNKDEFQFNPGNNANSFHLPPLMGQRDHNPRPKSDLEKQKEKSIIEARMWGKIQSIVKSEGKPSTEVLVANLPAIISILKFDEITVFLPFIGSIDRGLMSSILEQLTKQKDWDRVEALFAYSTKANLFDPPLTAALTALSKAFENHDWKVAISLLTPLYFFKEIDKRQKDPVSNKSIQDTLLDIFLSFSKPPEAMNMRVKDRILEEIALDPEEYKLFINALTPHNVLPPYIQSEKEKSNPSSNLGTAAATPSNPNDNPTQNTQTNTEPSISSNNNPTKINQTNTEPSISSNTNPTKTNQTPTEPPIITQLREIWTKYQKHLEKDMHKNNAGQVEPNENNQFNKLTTDKYNAVIQLIKILNPSNQSKKAHSDVIKEFKEKLTNTHSLFSQTRDPWYIEVTKQLLTLGFINLYRHVNKGHITKGDQFFHTSVSEIDKDQKGTPDPRPNKKSM